MSLHLAGVSLLHTELVYIVYHHTAKALCTLYVDLLVWEVVHARIRQACSM